MTRNPDNYAIGYDRKQNAYCVVSPDRLGARTVATVKVYGEFNQANIDTAAQRAVDIAKVLNLQQVQA